MNSLVKKHVDLEGLSLDAIATLSTSLEGIIEHHNALLPMACKGPTCVHATSCPLQQIGRAPVGSPCPVERILIENMVNQYVASLGIDPQNYVEMSMLADIVETEIYDMRTTGELAIDSLLLEQAVAVDKQGNLVTRKEASPLVEIKMAMKERKDRLRRAFMATREVKAKYKLRDFKDYSQIMSELRQIAEEQMKVLPAPLKSLDVIPPEPAPAELTGRPIDVV